VCGVTSWVGVAVAIARRARGGRWTTVDGVVRACASRVCVVVRRRRSSSFAFAFARRRARPHASRARDDARRDGDAHVRVARGARANDAERRRGRGGDAGAMWVASVAARRVACGDDGARDDEG
jgi:hypothetical protein